MKIIAFIFLALTLSIAAYYLNKYEKKVLSIKDKLNKSGTLDKIKDFIDKR